MHGQGHHFEQINHKKKDRTFLAKKALSKRQALRQKALKTLSFQKDRRFLKDFVLRAV